MRDAVLVRLSARTAPGPDADMAGRWRLSAVLGAALGCLLASGLHALRAVGDEPPSGGRGGPCTACHSMQPATDSWASGRHRRAAGCHDCHLPAEQPARFAVQLQSGVSHIVHEVADEAASAVRIRAASRHVVEANCARCHAHSRPPAETSAPAARAGCTHCHPHEGHR